MDFSRLSETIKAKELVGKKVMSDTGKEIGKVNAVHLDKESLAMAGIEVDRGLLEVDSFIGKDYISSIGNEGIFLNITPVSEYKGAKVLDADGHNVGHVKEVQRVGATNQLESIVIDRGLGKGDLVVARNDIQVFGDRIILGHRVKSVD